MGMEIVNTHFSFVGYFLGFFGDGSARPLGLTGVFSCSSLTRPWSIHLGFFFCLVLSVPPSHKCSLPLGGFIGPLGGDLRQNQDKPTKLSLTRGLCLVPCQVSFEETGRSQCRSTSSLSRLTCQRITHPQIPQTHPDICPPGTTTASDKY